jgi:hypothetical protein
MSVELGVGGGGLERGLEGSGNIKRKICALIRLEVAVEADRGGAWPRPATDKTHPALRHHPFFELWGEWPGVPAVSRLVGLRAAERGEEKRELGAQGHPLNSSGPVPCVRSRGCGGGGRAAWRVEGCGGTRVCCWAGFIGPCTMASCGAGCACVLRDGRVGGELREASFFFVFFWLTGTLVSRPVSFLDGWCSGQ